MKKREIAQDAADTRKAFSVPLESDAVETISTGEVKPNPFAVNKAPFNATSDEAAKKSVSQATLANNARDERVARVTSDEPGTELAETVGRIAPKADEPQQLRFINDILNRGAGEAAVDVAEVTTDPYAEDVVANNRIRFMPNEAVGGGVEAQDLSNYPAPKTNAEKTTTPKTNAEKNYNIAYHNR